MQSSPMAPPGFGQPLAPGAPLPKGVQNKQVRFANQSPPSPVIPTIPATGVPTQAGGKRRRRNTRKKRRTNRMRKSRRHI